jgi:hypothetical protein
MEICEWLSKLKYLIFKVCLHHYHCLTRSLTLGLCGRFIKKLRRIEIAGNEQEISLSTTSLSCEMWCRRCRSNRHTTHTVFKDFFKWVLCLILRVMCAQIFSYFSLDFWDFCKEIRKIFLLFFLVQMESSFI